jgi:phage gp46-like protein
MADLALLFTDERGGDLVLDGQDLARDDGLESAVLVSLFTDRRASAEQLRPGDDATDLRGWWGDIHATVDGDRFGSHLWLLRREKQTRETLARARQYARDALAWMLEDRVAASVSVATEYARPGVMFIGIDIARPSGDRLSFRFDYEWAAQAVKRVTR